MTSNAIQTRLRRLEKKYNPAGENLHFEGFFFGDVDLLPSLRDLLNELVEASRCNEEPLIAIEVSGGHGLWYDIFLATSAGAARIAEDKAAAYIHPEIVNDLVVALVRLSPFSHADGGDLCKRNYEAIANVLLTFHEAKLMRLARGTAKKLGKGAMWVVKVAIDAMERAQSEVRSRSKSSLDSMRSSPSSNTLRIPDSARPGHEKT